jgi:predicted DsbA family dithiol-disulfide isomerase
LEAEMSEGEQALTIDVVSDVVCPWCYLGKRRLALALAQGDGGPVAVRWRPYQLDPTIPAGGMDRRAYLVMKFRDDKRLDEVHARLTALGAEVGIAYRFDAISRAPNTLDAHRLIRWAAVADAQERVVERLFRLYFEEGRDIGERALLVEVARECGMDGAAAEQGLADGRDVEAVRAEIAEAQSLGVTGVPFFIFASRLAVSGAQSVDALVKAIAQARASLAGVEAP